ncbi:YitT family protein [Sporosalibacterium faouarense]|uniref:YitT family protein n=1 Tax=Sporosalibacterium faouarense TaxID=516123 RepID=UPI00141D4986|nr:YitT family protein [Sporosalibacterium faouarense]MTI48643.1 YitT family protein [Bacillota bacterium]
MKKYERRWYKYVIDYLGITVGTVIMAIAINMFLDPNTIAPGGVTGLGIVIKKVTDGLIPVDVTNLVINIPLFIGGVLILGKSFGAKTLYATLALSFAIRFIPTASATSDMLLASVFGGVLIGIGLGIVFKFGGTTGGTDLAGAILNKFSPGLTTATYMMIIDLCVVATSGIVGKNIETALYSVLALYILVKVIDIIQEGISYAKAFLIISNDPEEMGKTILDEIDRGVTVLKGQGMYTGEDRDVLLCVVNRAQVTKLKEVVNKIDNRAFVMVADIHEVLGEGFKEISSE